MFHTAFRQGRTRLALASAVVAALALGGCAADAGGETPAGEPRSGGTATIVQSVDISPATIMTQNTPNLSLTRLVFNNLVDLDHETLEPIPQLATSWEVSDDSSRITFELRDDVTYHDGRPFTADDVISSIEAIQREDVPSQLKHVAMQVTEMTADGDASVTIQLGRSVSNLWDLFALMPIIDVNTFDDLLAGTAFNGTGAFVVEEYTPGQGVSLVKNETYWIDGLPYLDAVDIDVVRDSQSMASTVRSGQAQLALNLAPLDAEALAGDPSFAILQSDARDTNYYVASNVNVPLLSDPMVRQAISYAVDRERIVDQVLRGNGTATSLPWAPSSPAFDEDLVDTYAYDPDRAADMLDEAGVTGEAVNLYYDANFGAAAGIAEIVQFNLTEAGLNAASMPLQAGEFNERLRGGTLDGLFISIHGFNQISPATLVKGAFPFNAEGNASQFDDEEYKALAEELWSESDPAALQDVYDRLNQFFLDQQFVSDLVNSAATYSTAAAVQGVDITMLDYLVLDEAYLSTP